MKKSCRRSSTLLLAEGVFKSPLCFSLRLVLQLRMLLFGFADNFFTRLRCAPYELDYFQCRMGNPATGDWKVGSVLIASEPR